ncbi:MAG: hypothetical protein QM710_14430 [Flavobacterium sp.]
MGRTKERPKLMHQANTLGYLYCLGDMKKWSQILCDQNNGKAYSEFLIWLLPQQFFGIEEKISVKRISELSGYPSAKISKWLKEIYEDIFYLNENAPQLFYSPGEVEVEFYFKYFDSHCGFRTSLPSLPRQYESVDVFFVNAKVGTSHFWVKDVRHFIGEERTFVIIYLEGGLLNIYREFALSKALFDGSLGFMDVYQKNQFEIDDLLKQRR